MQPKNKAPAPPDCDDTPLWDLLMTVYHLPVLTVADEIGLFSRLEQAPATPEEIASQLSLNVPGTTALLNALTALALLEQRQGKFYLTQPARHFLLPESPYYWGDVLRLQQHVRPETIHAALHRAVRREQPVSGGQSLWDRQAQDPATAYAFVRAMHNVSFPAALGVAHRGDFTGVTRLLDVGGGSGCFSIALATRYPHMGFTVMDLPAICPLAEQYVADYQLMAQIDTLPANMFKDPWPGDYDAVFFSNVFHDWDRDRCRFLAGRSFDLLPSGGHIYLHEMLLTDTRDGPLAAACFSVSMLITTEGQQFTAAELEELLHTAGFRDVTLTPTSGYYWLMRATKP